MRVVFWYISAALAATVGLYLLWSDYQIRSDGAITNAIVTSKVPGRPRWIYTFAVGKQPYFGETRALRSPGNKIKVSYIPGNPKESRDLSDDFWSWSGTIFILAAIALSARGAVLTKHGKKISSPATFP